jgi:putative membrane protein
VLPLLFLALIGPIVWLIIRLRRPTARDSTHQARQVLADRYAKGELSTDEYTERLEHLG